MSDQTHFKIPAFALPLVFAAGSGLMAYASMMTTVEAQAATVDEIREKVEKSAEQIAENETGTKLNSQAIQAITEKLNEQVEVARTSDAKLQELINLMIRQASK